MFHALITAKDQCHMTAVEVSGDVAPYDLQLLREHLLHMRRRRGALQVRLRAAFAMRPWIRAQLGDLDRQGVSLDFQR
jgi:hypothetical protein